MRFTLGLLTSCLAIDRNQTATMGFLQHKDARGNEPPSPSEIDTIRRSIAVSRAQFSALAGMPYNRNLKKHAVARKARELIDSELLIAWQQHHQRHSERTRTRRHTNRRRADDLAIAVPACVVGETLLHGTPLFAGSFYGTSC